jgi:heptosyltransferase-2
MKICIIKLGADGDVLRTLPLAKALKDKHKEAEITWITKGDIKSLIENINYIKNVSTVPYFGLDKFDFLYNFDIDKEALELADKIKADKKYGFYNDSGFPAAFNSGASYYLDTIFDDELKKENKKTYQEMMSMAAELPYNKEKYKIILNDKDKKYAQDFKNKNKIEKGKIIGIHMGASSRWPSKVWSEKKVVDFIKLARRDNYQIILFGGPNEVDKHKILADKLNKQGLSIFRNNPNNSKREFAALVDLCDVVVCSDSFSLHVSLGLGKKTVCLFFCTSPDEVEDYNILKKVVSKKIYEFFPERMNEYNEDLVNSISVEEVMKAVQE